MKQNTQAQIMSFPKHTDLLGRWHYPDFKLTDNYLKMKKEKQKTKTKTKLLH